MTTAPATNRLDRRTTAEVDMDATPTKETQMTTTTTRYIVLDPTGAPVSDHPAAPQASDAAAWASYR